jgi:SIR2-like protein
MGMWQGLDSYADNHNHHLALGKLGPLLREGSLTLFMGAGLSMSSKKYQNWPDLVRSCTSELKLNKVIADNEPIDNLLRYMDDVRRKIKNEAKYRELVNKHLNAAAALDYSDAANLLLMAVGALCMGSKRGSIKEVVTYNFDDLLEWYFALNGFVAQPVTDLPFLAKDPDVTVYHPHGFLPKLTKKGNSQRFVFDQLSYERTIGNENDAWFALCKQILLSKIAIFVGLSGKDPAMMTLVQRVHDTLEAQQQLRPVGFLLILDSEIGDGDKEHFIERGVIPLGFKNHDEIYKFLFQISKKASDGMKV